MSSWIGASWPLPASSRCGQRSRSLVSCRPFSSRAASSCRGASSGRGTILSVSQRLRNGLVLSEVALAVLLVIGAGLLIRSLWTLSHVNPGFRSEQVVTARITPNESFCKDVDRCLRSIGRSSTEFAVDAGRLRRRAGEYASARRTDRKAIDRDRGLRRPAGEGSPLFWLDIVSPDYFRVLGIPMVAGSAFSEADYSGNPPVAIVSAATARRFWGDGTAIGRRIPLRGRNATGGRSSASWPTCAPTTSSATEPEWIAGHGLCALEPEGDAGGRARAGADDDRHPHGLRRRPKWMPCSDERSPGSIRTPR